VDVAILRASMTFARRAWGPNVSLVLPYSFIFLSGRIPFRRTPINLKINFPTPTFYDLCAAKLLRRRII
jgi:hypothetical protein